MKHSPPPDDSAKFSGHLRHYHRSGPPVQRSWDDWVEGGANKGRKRTGKLPRILGLLLAILALGGIVAGLIIEMR